MGRRAGALARPGAAPGTGHQRPAVGRGSLQRRGGPGRLGAAARRPVRADPGGGMTAADPAVVWHLPGELRGQLLAPAGGLRLAEWLRDGSAEVVKDAPHRTIYRVRSGSLDFFLKEYRAVGLRGRLRELLRP